MWERAGEVLGGVVFGEDGVEECAGGAAGVGAFEPVLVLFVGVGGSVSGGGGGG